MILHAEMPGVTDLVHQWKLNTIDTGMVPLFCVITKAHKEPCTIVNVLCNCTGKMVYRL